LLQGISNEARTWEKLIHRNVVQFYGFYLEDNMYHFCIEYVPLRSLAGYLRNPFFASSLDTLTLTKMALDAAKGMYYLHQHNIIHKNLGARNLMIVKDEDNSFIVKVADYGLTFDVTAEAFWLGELAPYKWLALEVFKSQQFTLQNDLWAFGVTMWELYEFGRIPYPELSMSETVEFLEKGGRLQIPANAPSVVQQLLPQCWDIDPQKRPTFASIAKDLYAFINPPPPLPRPQTPETPPQTPPESAQSPLTPRTPRAPSSSPQHSQESTPATATDIPEHRVSSTGLQEHSPATSPNQEKRITPSDLS